MNNVELFWHTDGDGKLETAVNGYTVIVERLLPAADACFIIHRGGEQPRPLASGNCPSVKDAMLAGAETARRISDAGTESTHSN